MNAPSFITEATRYWWLALLSGILFIIAGIWVLRTPLESYFLLAMLFAMIFLVTGAIEVFTAIAGRKVVTGWGWTLAGGILDLLVGFILVSNPLLSATVLPFVVGFGVLFRSVMAIGGSLEMKSMGVPSWGWLLALGIIGLLCSFILLSNPLFAGMTVVVWTAMAFIAIGIARIWAGFGMRSLGKIVKGK